jgi:hypothetical protein
MEQGAWSKEQEKQGKKLNEKKKQWLCAYQYALCA